MKSLQNIHFLTLILALCSMQAYSRQYAIVRYDQSNGFPGNHCYSIYQDKKGYIWMSTENGLARFNGYEFRLFTTKDGLPDNEAFCLNEDSKGRLWFAPFANAVGYIFNETVYDAKTDKTLRKLHFKSRPEEILLDSFGNVFFLEYPFVSCLSENGEVRRFYFKDKVARTSIIHAGRLQLITNENVFEYTSNKFVFKRSIADSIPFLRSSEYYATLYNRLINAIGLEAALQFFQKAMKSNKLFQDEEAVRKIKKAYVISPQTLAVTGENGCYLVDRMTTSILDTLLTGYNVGDSHESADSSLWLGTLGTGIFRFIPSQIHTVTFPSVPSAIQFIKATPDGMYCALENGRYATTLFEKAGILKLKEINYLRGMESDHPTAYIGMNEHGRWVVCSHGISLQSNLVDKPLVRTQPIASKNVFEEDKKHILVAHHSGLIRFDTERFSITDTLLDRRTTSVVKVGGTIYTGTLQGLFSGTTKENFQRIFSTNPSLNTHIVQLWATEDSNLWVANNKAELVALRNNQVVCKINDINGLQCNRISSIRSSKKFIWVGTDNGLFAFQNKSTYPLAFHLTYANGLSSTQVNCLDVQNGQVFVGTQSGVNYFDENAIVKQEPSTRLFVNSITSDDNAILHDTGTISLNGNSLSIDFDIIDYTGGQKPIFQYRFHNETNWISLENSNLYFPELPFGHFTIDIRATLPNWESSSQHKLSFCRQYPFYLRGWFIIIGTLFLLATVSGGIAFYIKRVRKKDNQKIIVQRNLLQLEQMALQGQLNPHFIFNCMTAIKQYYNMGNLQKANEFVDAFAALIRQTFEMSSKAFISLDIELNYLNRYLSIEQVRFDQAFDFFINKDLNISEIYIPVPAMLLQPLAENAVRHGVRHLSGRRGKVVIDVKQQDNRVQISITDNGVGRKGTTSFFSHITSTSVNAKRIKILNQLFEQQIVYKTEDIINNEGEIAGTCVIVSYPLDIYNL